MAEFYQRPGNYSLTGSSGADQIVGNGGDNLLTGGGGNDILNGGDGNDVARFAGAIAGYQLTTSGGTVRLTDINAADGNDGTDTLIGIETLTFAGGESMSIAAPIVLDLDGNGVGLISAANSVARFDMNGDGKEDDTSWFASGDALLFFDFDGNGTVTSAAEFSFVNSIPNAKSDLAGLAAFDINRDGHITSTDTTFASFRLWQDRNGDGVAGSDEITTLTQSQVASLNLTGTPTNLAAPMGGGAVINHGQFTRIDGTKGAFADAAFTYFSGAQDTPAATSISFVPQSYNKKASKYRLVAQGGQLSLVLNKSIDFDSALVTSLQPATLLSFDNKTVGLLSTIILDLDGDGIDLKSRKKSDARFDMDGEGTADDTGWIGKGDGFLVVDRDNDGTITSAELSLLAEDPEAQSGLQALASFDSNQNGQLDENDLRFKELKVWKDGDLDGVTDAGELSTLDGLGIASIGLGGSAMGKIADPGDNVLLATASFARTDGSTGLVGEAALAFKPGTGTADWDFGSLGTILEKMFGDDHPPGAGQKSSVSASQLIESIAAFGGKAGELDWASQLQEGDASDFFGGLASRLLRKTP